MRLLLAAAVLCVPLAAGVPSGAGPAEPAAAQVALRAAPCLPVETTLASWYGPGFDGRLTASGARYDQYGISAAHRTIPFGTRVRVTNLANCQSVVLQIQDRGPFVEGRGLDCSYGAAVALGFVREGLAPVLVEPLGAGE